MNITSAENWLHDLYTVLDVEKCIELNNKIFIELIKVIYNLLLYIVAYYKAVKVIILVVGSFVTFCVYVNSGLGVD